MRPITIDLDPANESTTAFLSGSTGAGPWTPASPNTSDGLAHQVSISSTSVAIAAIVFTITGTDENGKAQTDTITGVNNGTVESTKYFKSVTQISASATIGAATINAGTVDEIASQWIPLDWPRFVGATIAVDVTGTINFTVQETFTKVLAGEAPVWQSISALAAKTSDTTSSSTIGATAIRIITASYSSGAELQAYIVQPNT